MWELWLPPCSTLGQIRVGIDRYRIPGVHLYRGGGQILRRKPGGCKESSGFKRQVSEKLCNLEADRQQEGLGA